MYLAEHLTHHPSHIPILPVNIEYLHILDWKAHRKTQNYKHFLSWQRLQEMLIISSVLRFSDPREEALLKLICAQ